MAWACEQCPKSKPEDLMPYTHKLLNVYNLQRGGYPLTANDLTPEEWLDLARVRDLFRPPPFQCPFAREKE